MSKFSIQGSTLTGIADAVREMRGESGLMTPAEIQAKIEDSVIGCPTYVDCHVDNNGHWIRPQHYPNLDTLYETIGDDESCIYLTYDLSKTPGYGWIGVYVGGSSFVAERGHISNGVFVSDYSSGTLSSGPFRQNLDSANGEVQLWKISSAGNLTYVRFIPNTSGSSANNLRNNIQPCVERSGKLPYANTLASSAGTGPTDQCFGTAWLEKDRIIVGVKNPVTSITNLYYYCNSLRETNCGEWNTSHWTISSIGSIFSHCYYIKKLDLSGWDTSNWPVTNITYAWYYCFSLEELDVSTWDTSKWRPTNLEYTFYQNLSLKELDLSSWDTSEWLVTTLRGTWGYCCSLKKLDVSTWDTSKWPLTNIGSAWNYCNSLLHLPINNWDTSNWTITTMSYAWSHCCSLQELLIGSWDVSNWRPTSLLSTWNGCQSIKELPIEDWNVTDWPITSLEAAFASCSGIISLNLNSWDVSSWRPTSMQSTFYNCMSLRELQIDQWDVTDWPMTDFSRVFYNCYCLEEVDLTSWDVSNWAITTAYYLFNAMYGAKKIDLHNWDVSNWDLSNTQYLYTGTFIETLLLPAGFHGSVANAKYTGNLHGLINFAPPSLDIDQTFTNAIRLTRESLLTMIDRLPTVNTTKTFNIGQINRLKLTSAEIAVATQKGWTVT